MSTANRSQLPRPPPSPQRGSSNYNGRPGLVSNSSRRTSITPDANITTAIHKSLTVSGALPSKTNAVPETGSASTSNQLLTPSNGPTNQQKAKAKDLLRKHYGLGIGPPPPKPVGSNSQDPMDMSEFCLYWKFGIISHNALTRFIRFRREKLL
jgi:hypothetical protein